MTKITAGEARKLSGPSVHEHVDAVYTLIRAAAEKKQRQIRLHNSFWVQEGYSRTANYAAACKILEGEGYKVSFFYDERQFVDMYTVVEW